MADLTDSDKAAVAGLVTRYVEAWTRRDMDQRAAAQIAMQITILNDRIQKLAGALSIFAFDPADAAAWNSLRDALGPDAYANALAAGQRAALEQPVSVPPPPPPPSVAPPDEDDYEEIGQQVLDLVESDASPVPDGKPTVRDGLLSRLEQVHPHGAKAAELRQYLEQTYAMKLHEKTCGMTLYRLSQEDPPRVRRQGHTWFFVPPMAETKNPGVGAPGQSSVFD
jgi:hypothetical protein